MLLSLSLPVHASRPPGTQQPWRASQVCTPPALWQFLLLGILAVLCETQDLPEVHRTSSSAQALNTQPDRQTKYEEGKKVEEELERLCKASLMKRFDWGCACDKYRASHSQAVFTSCLFEVIFASLPFSMLMSKFGCRFNAESVQQTERRWRDGSLEEDLPMRSLSEMFKRELLLSQPDQSSHRPRPQPQEAGQQKARQCGGD